VVLDEIHKSARWRNLVKGFYDTRRSRRLSRSIWARAIMFTPQRESVFSHITASARNSNCPEKALILSVEWTVMVIKSCKDNETENLFNDLSVQQLPEKAIMKNELL
jgi:hypothetical protein